MNPTAQKMTLMEYIESRNYKRRLSSNSKSKNKYQQQRTNHLLAGSIDPSVLTLSDTKDQQKIQLQMSDLAHQLKQIDQKVQGFSVLHKKIEGIKDLARQYIRQDKSFVLFCKRLDELDSLYRYELMQAYRFQLFKFTFENQGKLDDEKKKMLKILNDHYMESKFQYKKSINKETAWLSKAQASLFSHVIKSSVEASKKLIESTEKSKDTPLIFSMLAGSMTGSMTESKFIPKEQSTDQVKKTQKISPNKTKTLSSNNINSQQHIESAQTKKNNVELMRSPSAKKVAFIPYHFMQQNLNQHSIPDFEAKKVSLMSNPEQAIKEIDQSDVNLDSNKQSSVSGNEAVGSLLFLINKKSSKQQKLKPIENPSKPELKIMRQYETQPAKKGHSKRSKSLKKKTAKQIREQRQQKSRQKLLQSKDYLKPKR